MKNTLLSIWRIVATFVVGTAICSGMAFMGAMLVAIPLGIAWDLLLWALQVRLPGDSIGMERIVQSHFTWGISVGVGATIWWQKVGDWREVAAIPLFGRITTSADSQKGDA